MNGRTGQRDDNNCFYRSWMSVIRKALDPCSVYNMI